jgi:hypothetical protein
MKKRETVLLGSLLLLLIAQVGVLVLVNLRPRPSTFVQHTPIPTLIPVLPVMAAKSDWQGGECRISALNLIGDWVQTGKSENDLFLFDSLNGDSCQGTFTTDVLPLFREPNLWYPGAIACASCHGEDLKLAAAHLSLVSYQAILAGANRNDSSASGEDILGSKDGWQKSKLYNQLFTRQMPFGRPANSPQEGPIVRVGKINK